MFWRKARKIKYLQELLDEKIDRISGMSKEISALREAKVGLTADRDAARDNVTKLTGEIHESSDKIAALISERDQFAKQVEELGQKLSDLRAEYGRAVPEAEVIQLRESS